MAKAWVVLGALAMVASVQAEAHACLHPMQRHNPAIATLGEADRLVEGGNPQDAMRWVYASSPSFMKDKPGQSAVSDMALSILARAAVRSDGAAFLAHEAAPPSGEQRQAALVWAASVSRVFHHAKPYDPVATTRLAEALARMPKNQPEALVLLEPLERSDLLPSAHGYAALANLRGEMVKDQPTFVRGPLLAMAAGKQALERARCERMTKDRGICVGSPINPAKPNPAVRQAAFAEVQRVDDHNRLVNRSRFIDLSD
jgi:hypothetical protein